MSIPFRWLQNTAASRAGATPWQLLACGLASGCVLVSMALLAPLREQFLPFVAAFALLFALYVLAMRALGVFAPVTPGEDRQGLALVLLFAVAFRLTLLATTPWLSEDIYRYLWDARVLGAGINPYQHAPGAEQLAPLRNSLYAPINHKDIGTPYGPLSLVVFWLANALGQSVLAMKTAMVLADVGVIVLLVQMLKKCALPATNVVVYAWNPLVLVEIAGNGHNDTLAILPLMLALHAVISGRPWLAVAAFSLASLAKYLALLALPALWLNARTWHWVFYPLLLALAFLPYAAHLEQHVLHLVTVGASWQFNDSVFRILLLATGSATAAKAIAAAAFVAACIVVAWRRLPATLSVFVLLGTAMCVTTTLQPWYLVWIVPLLCFHPNRAWLLLSGLVILSYHVLIGYQAGGAWAQQAWVKLLIFVPFYGLLARRAWQVLRR